MTTWLYCICRNEAKLMPYFLRHYATFVDKIIIYDDASDDGTREIIKTCPQAELLDWKGTHGIVDDEFLYFANRQWHEARGKADWVLWVDSDEIIYHPQIKQLLERYLKEGVEVPSIKGFGMVSAKMPSCEGQIYDEIKTGFRSPEWDKHVVFQPKLDLRWEVGRHCLDLSYMKKFPKGSDESELKLLHYRYLGLDYIAARNSRNFNLLPDRCRRHSYGDNTYPNATKPYSTHWFKTFLNQPFPEVI